MKGLFRKGQQSCVAGEVSQPKQVQDRHRVGGGEGSVISILDPKNDRLVPAGGAEKASPRLILKAQDHRLVEIQGPQQPLLLQGGLVEVEQTLYQKGIVVEKSVDPGLCVSISPQQGVLLFVVERGPHKAAGTAVSEISFTSTWPSLLIRSSMMPFAVCTRITRLLVSR